MVQVPEASPGPVLRGSERSAAPGATQMTITSHPGDQGSTRFQNSRVTERCLGASLSNSDRRHVETAGSRRINILGESKESTWRQASSRYSCFPSNMCLPCYSPAVSPTRWLCHVKGSGLDRGHGHYFKLLRSPLLQY